MDFILQCHIIARLEALKAYLPDHAKEYWPMLEDLWIIEAYRELDWSPTEALTVFEEYLRIFEIGFEGE